MFRPKATIQVKVKLFGGLDTFAGIENYDPDVGLTVAVPKNIRLGKVIKKLGLGNTGSISLFVNGNAAALRERLKDGDIIFCMRPVAGG